MKNKNKFYDKLINIALCFVPIIFMLLINAFNIKSYNFIQRKFGENYVNKALLAKFQLLQLFVSVSSAALGIKSYRAQYQKFTFIFAVFLFVFNPIIPVKLESANWVLMNIAFTITSIFFWFYSRKNN